MPLDNPLTNVAPVSEFIAKFQFLETHYFPADQLSAFTSQTFGRAQKYLGQMIFIHPKYVLAREKSHVLTIVLDLDQTLIDTRFGSQQLKYYIRPYARKLLAQISSLKNADGNRAIELILWSAGTYQHVALALTILDPDQDIFDYVIARGNWHTDPPKKDLSMLEDRRHTCIIIDDAESVAAANGNNALLIHRFFHGKLPVSSDKTLHVVTQVTTWLSKILIAVDHYRDQHKLERTSPCLSDVHLVLDSASQRIFSSIVKSGIEFNVGDLLAKHPAVEAQVIAGHHVLKLNEKFECSNARAVQPADPSLFRVISHQPSSSLAVKRPLLHSSAFKTVSKGIKDDSTGAVLDHLEAGLEPRSSKRPCLNQCIP